MEFLYKLIKGIVTLFEPNAWDDFFKFEGFFAWLVGLFKGDAK